MTKSHDKKHEPGNLKSSLDITAEKTGPAPKGKEAHLPGADMAAIREKAAKADDYYDRLLRTAAELENYKKRVERERGDLLKFAHEELMAELIMVIDNFERALAAASHSAEKGSMVEGIRLIHKQLLTVLQKNGLSPIAALGQPFNPEFHEAVAEVETGEQPDGTVIAEQLRGYTLNGRLVRPAVVTVARRHATPSPPHTEIPNDRGEPPR